MVMSKRFRNKTCVYCGQINSETGDHIFAREFFLLDKRNNLPKVPACKSCNNDKSTLEHYLLSVLPFGARHADAATNLENMVPPRLTKNAKLHRQLAAGTDREWINENGILLRGLTLPFDGEKLEGLFRYIVKGLLWHHWQVSLTKDHFVGAGMLSNAGETVFDKLFNLNAKNRVNISLGEGTIRYEGAQATDNPHISLWKFSIYGGLKFGGDADLPHETPSTVWGITCRNAVRPDFWKTA